MSTRWKMRGGAVAAAGWLIVGVPWAAAQVTPDRTYYGISRAIPMTVAVPAEMAGAVEIHLLAAGDARVVERAPAAAGAVDLAALFPTLWSTMEPRVLYAQLVVGETKVGPAVVLQPMLSPAYAPRVDAKGDPMFPAPEQRRLHSGLRAYVDKHVVMETSKGAITIALRPDAAPNTAWNFRHLVEGGFYTDIIIHRVDNRAQGFVIQFGDPTGTGGGGPGYYIDLEPSPLPHGFGVISMARTPDPNSNGSQIFICLSRERTAPLDGKYTTFGQTVGGAETIQAIAGVPVGAQDRPIDPPMVRSARLVDAPPHGEGPRPVEKPGAGSPER